jgi:hypothetical protein
MAIMKSNPPTSKSSIVSAVAISLLTCVAANLFTNLLISLFAASYSYLHTDQLVFVGVIAVLFALIRYKVSSNATHTLLGVLYGVLWAIIQFIRTLYS